MEAIFGAILAYAIIAVCVCLTGLVFRAFIDKSDEYGASKRLLKGAIIWPVLIVSFASELHSLNKQIRTLKKNAATR